VKIESLHHIAIICSDYEKSKQFYTSILGFKIDKETYRATAHFNYIGNSIVGRNVNFEAGSICANHFNERQDKRILIKHNNEMLDCKTEKFGYLVGDNSRIGANAVLSPGTILEKNSIVRRLQLIEQ
jgi:bifunctional N-acetylglucosamine-1-phosphate-uridyltransferase/glucosamine-1-phosphate-acetyltransferase GlmU-like protein